MDHQSVVQFSLRRSLIGGFPNERFDPLWNYQKPFQDGNKEFGNPERHGSTSCGGLDQTDTFFDFDH